MEKELLKLTTDLLENFNETTMADKVKKLKDISRFIQRDLRAMFILSSAIDLTHYNASLSEFRDSMKEFTLRGEELAPKLNTDILTNGKTPIDTIKLFVEEHIQVLRNSLMNRVSVTVEALKADTQEAQTRRSLSTRPIVVVSSESIEDNLIPQKGDNESGSKSKEKDSGKKSSGSAKGLNNSRLGFQNNQNALSFLIFFPEQEVITVFKVS